MDKKQDNKKIGHTSMKNDKISFSCHICDSWFIGKGDLVKHIAKAHQNKKEIKERIEKETKKLVQVEKIETSAKENNETKYKCEEINNVVSKNGKGNNTSVIQNDRKNSSSMTANIRKNNTFVTRKEKDKNLLVTQKDKRNKPQNNTENKTLDIQRKITDYGPNNLKCNFCKSSFSNKKILDKHIELLHGNTDSALSCTSTIHKIDRSAPVKRSGKGKKH